MPEGSTVSVVDVSKSISETQLLAPVSFDVAPGTCLVLQGVNGSGKTTLLRLLAGQIDPSTGSVSVDERAADERDPVLRERIAALIGAPATYRDLTLADHLTLIDATWGRDPETCEQRVSEQLAMLQIEALQSRFPHELSSGQGQLFRLALVLFRPGTLLILDEPEQRLDTDKRVLVADLIVARRRVGTTVVMACHDPAMTEQVADDVLQLSGS